MQKLLKSLSKVEDELLLTLVVRNAVYKARLLREKLKKRQSGG